MRNAVGCKGVRIIICAKIVQMREQLFSFAYRASRSLLKCLVSATQLLCAKPSDLESVITIGKKGITLLNKSPFKALVSSFSTPKHAAVTVHDLHFDSPLTFSAYESHFDLLEFFLNLGAGGGALKTMMAEKRSGNSRPRIQELYYKGEKSLVNAMGLPGYGVDAFVKELLASKVLSKRKPLGLSIGGESVDEYMQAFEKYQRLLGGLDYPFYYEVNISCPNTDSGQDLSKNVNLLKDFIQQMRASTSRVISVKLSPDQSDEELLSTAKMLQGFEKIVINVGNTQFKSKQELGLKGHLLPREGGGLSGPVLFKRTLNMLTLLKPFGIPLIATGGINSVLRAKEALQAGATLIGMATALAFDPYIIVRINKALK